MCEHLEQSRRLAREASASLESARGRAGGVGSFVGFDGFVDTIVRAVRRRGGSGYEDFEPMERMEELAKRVEQASGRSANIELAVERVKPGGNGVLMASGLAALGARVTYFGNLDVASIGTSEPGRLHPVFEAFAAACERVFSLGPAGLTDAVEFEDGKLLLGKLESMEGVTWEAAVAAAGGIEPLRELASGARLFAMCNWTMIEGMNEIWRGLTEDVLAKLEGGREARMVFVDLADPAKRTNDDLEEAMARLGAMNRRARVTLGLNLVESERVGKLVGARSVRGGETSDAHELEKAAASLREKLGLEGVVIHHQRGAAAAEKGEIASMLGPFVRRPKISTGAGDHFNAGYAFGAALELPIGERLAAAAGVSGIYVRHGEAPTLGALTEFLRDLPAPE